MSPDTLLLYQLNFLAGFFSMSEGQNFTRKSDYKQYRRLFEVRWVGIGLPRRERVVLEFFETFRDSPSHQVVVPLGNTDKFLEAIRLLMEFFPPTSDYRRDIPAHPKPYLEFVSVLRDFEHPAWDVEDRLEAGTLVLSEDALRVARAAGCHFDIERIRAKARVPLPGSEERQATDALVAELNLTPRRRT
jgi:hypothetical protein